MMKNPVPNKIIRPKGISVKTMESILRIKFVHVYLKRIFQIIIAEIQDPANSPRKGKREIRRKSFTKSKSKSKKRKSRKN